MPVQITCDNCGKTVVRSPAEAQTKTLFCSTRCNGLFHAERRNINAAERFWAKVAIGAPDACWEWTAYRGRRGYGQAGWMGKVKPAHRIALSLTDGDWDNRLHVCHTCDNPPCCNPAHLWRGTQSQNTRDMLAKGRNRFITLRGEASVQAKLTDADVREIRSSAARGVDLARKYNVTRSLIGLVRKHRAWRHLP